MRMKEHELKPFADTLSIFIHIPKTAGTSVRTALYGANVGYHMSLRDYYLAYSAEEYLGRFKFAFIRNPWDRLYSTYCYLSSNRCTKMDRMFWASHFGGIDFIEFVDLIKQRGLPGYLHFLPQISFLCPSRFPLFASRELGVNFIGIFENLDSDFSYISRKLGVSASLEHLNSSRQRRHDSFLHSYSSDSAAVVAKLYASDIHAFRYSFDNSSIRSQIALRDTGDLSPYR